MKKFNNLRFHHIGKPVPLEQIKNHPDVKYSPLFDMYSLDQWNDLGIPIELHAFGEQSTLDEKIQTQTHIAFTCKNIEEALLGEEIIMPLYEPFKDYRCAMIWVNHQAIELIETTLSEAKIWGDAPFKDSLLYPKD